MPGENLHKLTTAELRELRRIVRKVYGEQQGMTREQAEQAFDDRECDKLIDSLLPETVEELHKIGIQSKWVESKQFLKPSIIVGLNGDPILRR